MKKIHENLLKGTIAEDKVGVIIQEKMGYIWRPSSRYDIGYDGEIEIRDDVTGEVKGLIIKVQSKSIQSLDTNADNSFSYKCSQDDFEYWLASNVPDILVISQSKSDEVYWSPIKEYFKNYPQHKKDRKIIFNKNKCRFDISAKHEIARLAVPKDSGLFIPAINKQEKLISNLLQINTIPDKIYHAQTEFRDPKELIATLKNRDEYIPRQWILKNKNIISFNSLENSIWTGLIEKGTLEVFESNEWALSEDEDKRFEFVRLLNSNLKEKCWNLGFKFDTEFKYFYFRTLNKQIERTISYKSLVNTVTREVIKAIYFKTDPGKLKYFRHLAFFGKFQFIEQNWFLEINPTYYFSYDGNYRYTYYEDQLKGLKKIQKNENVLGEVICIAEYLKTPNNLFNRNNNYLTFSNLMEFNVLKGIEDQAWLKLDEEKNSDNDDELYEFSLPLFNEL